jgi:hypothetical protein
MNKRYGAKYSPSGQIPADYREEPVDIRVVDAAGARSKWLIFPIVPLVFLNLWAGPFQLAIALTAAAILGLAVWLLRDGLRAEAAYNARKVARRPALPRKMIATGLTGIGVTMAALLAQYGIAGSLVYGIIAAGLHLTAFGIDPLKDKLMEGIDEFQQDRVARVVDEAEAYLTTIRDQIARLGDRPLQLRVQGFLTTARKMIRTVEDDPRDLTAARKYLGVYLMGARDATVRFAEVFARSKDASARADYEALLADLETNFAAKTGKMLESNRSDMDIEIKVLRDRLQREGVKPE